MARIRTIKPEFFKHLELQELECSNPGQYIMLVYAGLWTQCDKNGVFFYNSKVLKNEILPYLDFDIQKTLDILLKEQYFIVFNSGNRKYGYIPNFGKYQFPTANEKKCPAKYPPPPDIAHFETFPSTSQDVPKNVPENHTENHTEPEGLKDHRIKGSQEFVAYFDPETPDDPQTLSAASAAAPEKAIVPVQRPPPKEKNSIELNSEQLALFNAAKACFESSGKAKALLFKDRSTAAMQMRKLKEIVVSCTAIEPEFSVDFLRNVLEHFRVLTNGKLKGKVEFTPRALSTPWVWEAVIGSLSENNVTPELLEIIKGMFK